MESNFEPKEAQRNQVLYCFLEYLQDLKKELDEDTAESVDVACQCINSAFGIDLQNEEQKQKYSIKPQTVPIVFGTGLAGKEKITFALEELHKQKKTIEDDLESKFMQYVQSIRKKGFFNGVTPGSNEYEQRYARARQKFISSLKPQESPKEEQPVIEPVKVTVPPPLTKEQIDLAEKYKMEGNVKLSAKQFSEAIELYTKAIQVNPANAIYYANRAAAYTHLGKHEEALKDCQVSIEKDPKYVKAYGRLGLAHFSLGNYKEAVEAYNKALELEPENKNFKESLAVAQQKLNKGDLDESPMETDTSNIPDQLPGNMNDLFNNPEIRNMASEFMNNPQMMAMAQSIMQNPEALNNLMNAFGGNLEKIMYLTKIRWQQTKLKSKIKKLIFFTNLPSLIPLFFH